MLRPSRLTRYVLVELASASLLSVLLWTLILLMNQFFFVAREAISKGLSAAITIELIALQLPKILVYALPMGTLLGSLVAVGRLSSDGEIVAIQAAGLGRRFLVRPVLVHGIVMTLAAGFVYGPLQPWTEYRLRTLRLRILATADLTSELRPRVFFEGLPGMVLFVNEILPGTSGQLSGTLLYRPDNGAKYQELILSREAIVSPLRDGDGKIELDLRAGVSHVFRSAEPEAYRTYAFERYRPTPLDPPPIFQLASRPLAKAVQNMTPGDLVREARQAGQEKDPILREFRLRNVLVELHSRAALPLACLLFALLALPLGMARVRSGKVAGFAVSFGIIVLYWLIFTIGRGQALDGRAPPALAIWLANLVIAGWAVLAFRRLLKSRREEGILARVFWRARRILGRIAWRDSVRERISPATGARSAAREAVEAVPPRRFPNLVDRYVLKLYSSLLLYAIGFCYLVFALVESRDLLDGVMEKHQPIGAVIEYYKFFLPGALSLVLPISCLIGAVIACTLLGKSGELTAMKAAGMSMHRLAAPILGLTAILCVGFFLVQDRIAPETTRRAQEVKDRILGRSPRTYGVSPGGRWTFGTEGRLYHYRFYDSSRQEFQGLSVFQVDLTRPVILAHRFVESAAWSGGGWKSGAGWYRSFPQDEGSGEFRRTAAGEALDMDPPENFSRRELTLAAGSDLPERLSLAELGDQISGLANSGYDTTRLRVAWFTKVASPVTPLIMVLLGLPFAFKVGRRGSMYGAGVSLILVIVYWATFAVFNALGLQAILPPFLAAWAPNLFFGLLGGYLLIFIKT